MEEETKLERRRKSAPERTGTLHAPGDYAGEESGKLMEVPIGCVIVYEGKVIARGYNRRIRIKHAVPRGTECDPEASKKLGDWRLEGCTLYVTLEPCQMCAGAIVQARVSEVVIGSMNPKAGCAGSILKYAGNARVLTIR